MAHYIQPNTSSTVNHTTSLSAVVEGGIRTIQWRINGAPISGKTGLTSDPFYLTLNTGDPGDFNFTASDTGSYIDFLIDPTPGPPETSQTLVLSNNSPTLSAAGPLTDAYDRSSTTPTFVWTYADEDSDPQFQYRVKLGSTAGGTDYLDSGIITTDAATTFSYTISNGILTEGQSYYWTIEVSDGEKVDPFDVSTNPTRVISLASGTGIVDTPSAVGDVKIDGVSGGGTIASLTPTISWNYLDIDGQPQTSHRIIVATDVLFENVLWDSLRIPGAATSEKYNFNLLGDSLTPHVLLYVGVTVSDGISNSNQAVETFVLSSRPIITSLTVDSKINPLNVRGITPFFNWVYTDVEGDPLIGYEIRVSDVDTDLGTDSFIGAVWNPGIIFSPESYGVRFNAEGSAFSGCPPYPGTLIAGVRYYYQVKIQDAYGISDWAVGYFELNSPPTAENLEIIPAVPYSSDDLLARYDFVDDIGDVEANSQIRWFRQASDETEYSEVTAYRNTLSIPASETTAGDLWKFSVRPSDGIDFSVLTYESDPVTIINRAPTATALAILPSQPRTTDNLEAIFALSDPDEDSVQATISWFKNDVEQVELKNSKIIPASVTSVDDEWYFTILPNDGYENGPLATSSKVTILNTPPYLTSISLDGQILAKALNDSNPTISWTYEDDDVQAQEKFQVILGTKPARTKKTLTNIREISLSSAGTGLALTCGGEDGVISTAQSDGTLVSGDEIFDSGIIESSDTFYEYITDDFKRQVVIGAVSFTNLSGYTVAPDLQTLMLQTGATTGTAGAKFTGQSAFYNIELTYIKEETKRSTYKISVDGTIVGQFTSQVGIGPATHIFNAIRIENSAAVAVVGLAADPGAKVKFRQLLCSPITQLPLNAGEFKTLSGYLLDGTGGIKLAGLAGTATTAFLFPSGTYDVEFIYVTETSGNPTASLSINNSVALSFTYESGAQTRSRFISGLDINKGDTIKISGTRNAGAQARVKKVIFRPTETVKVGAKLKDGLTYFASVRAFDGQDWSDWFTTKFTMAGSAWSTVSNSKGWTIETRFKVTATLPPEKTIVHTS